MSKAFMKFAKEKEQCHVCGEMFEDIYDHLTKCKVKERLFKEFQEDNPLPF